VLQSSRPVKAPTLSPAQQEALEAKFSQEAAHVTLSDHNDRLSDHFQRRPLLRRQLQIETDTYTNAVKMYRELLPKLNAFGLGAQIPVSKRQLVEWFAPLAAAVAAEQAACRGDRKHAHGPDYRDFLCQLPPDKLAVITIHETLALMLAATATPPSSQAAAAVSLASGLGLGALESDANHSPVGHVAANIAGSPVRAVLRVASLTSRIGAAVQREANLLRLQHLNKGVYTSVRRSKACNSIA
jgi:hypothetical protein